MNSTQRMVLDVWKLATPEDAEYYVAEFNYHVNLAYNEVMGLPPDLPQGEAFAITDSTGEVVGYMGSYMSRDSVHTELALASDDLEAREQANAIIAELKE
ncbi:MAG: hypothetical protein O2862_05875 [Bacteroidetes bacterium]|nr:hypothetical protein [Bacteroidota bacterium]